MKLFTYRNMRQAGQTTNRPEQMLAYYLIQGHLKQKVELEYKPPHLRALPDVDLTGDRSPKLDLAVPSIRVAIRVMGQSHDNLPQERYDNIQRIFLEMQHPPWHVVDLWYYSLETLWKCRERGLSSQELEEAYSELYEKLHKVLDLREKPNRWVIQELAKSQKLHASKL